MHANLRSLKESSARLSKFVQMAFVILLVGWVGHASAETPSRIKIAASIFPIANIAEHVGEGAVEVITIVPPGADPHTFEWKPSALKGLRHAKAVFMVGHGFDDWLHGSLEALPEAEMIFVGSGAYVILDHAIDPHYWLSIANAEIIAMNIADELSRLDSSRKALYEENAKNYVKLLQQTGEKASALLAPHKEQKIVTVHDSFRYFAHDFGIQIIATVEPRRGSEPTPKHLAALQTKIKENNIKVLFSQSTSRATVGEALASDLKLRIYALDPIGGTEGRDSYQDLILYNAKTMHEALTSA